jgi:ABC-type transporter Mla subunit MlaD
VRGHLQYRRVMRVVNLVGCCTTVVLALVLAALAYQSTKPFRGNVEVTVETQAPRAADSSRRSAGSPQIAKTTSCC